MMNEQPVFMNENLCVGVIKKITMLLLVLLFVLAPVNSQYSNTTERVENVLTNPCTDKNHLVLAPGVLKAGGVNRACVSRFYTDGTARLVLTLVSQDRQMTTASRELPPGDGGCLDFNVPLLPNTKADLFAKLFYKDAQCTWERRLVLRVASARLLLVQTERARYRPGDVVRARLLALKPDQAPSHEAIEDVWLEGPKGAWEGTRVTQWQQVRTRLGLAQLQYQLDPLAPPGKWTLRAKLADGSQGSAVFWVGNYELPPFQLSVRHPPRVLRTSDRLVWTVCVRYPWSEAVEGMLVIRLRGAGGGGTGVRTAVQLRAPKACHRHAVAAKRVGLHSQNPPDVLVADFSFQEEGTRIWQNTTVVSQVVEKPVTLEFLTKHRAVLSPGLPHKLKLKATRWDEKPATGERVRVCRHPTIQPAGVTSPVTSHACAEGDADVAGVARVMFPAVQDDVPFYRFEAHLKSDNSTTASLTVLVRPGAVQAALGPLRAELGSSRVLVPLYINTDLDTPLTVHFVVVTRGGIIYRWGATTQCPGNNDQIHTAPRHDRCNNHYYAYNQDYTQTNENEALNQNRLKRNVSATQNDPNSIQTEIKFAQNLSLKENQNNGIEDFKTFDPNSININESITGLNLQTKQNTPLRSFSASDAQKYHKSKLYQSLSDPVGVKETENVTVTSDALLDRKLKVMLPIKVSHQMCPDSHLIAYFYYNGELVSAAKHFETTECFANKVEATWLSRQAQPGSTVSLQVSTPGPALCAVSVLHAAAKWAQPPPTTKELLMASLRRLIDTHTNLTEYDAAGDCFLNSDTLVAPTSSMELTLSWLASAGLRAVGGAPRARDQRCVTPPPAALVTDDAEPRTDFSEAWLWRVVSLGTNGTSTVGARAPHGVSRYDAAVTCVSRTGIAVAAPATLQVFREFFIHADGPKRLRRGDSAIIRYRVFNYLYEPLSIQIQILTDPHMEVTSESVESACIAARSSVARRVRVKARVASPARVSLRAKTVRNDNCPNVTATVNVSDEVIIQITVEPEGVPVQEQKSILLCGNGNVGQSSAQLGSPRVDWSFPRVGAVRGTEALTLWAVADVTGPLLADADSLVQIPRGCGEQNMAQLATNLLALKHLDSTSIAAFTAKEHVARGFTRQLQYVHPSGGFSAFGPSDLTSSTWLTAFAVKHLRKAHQLLWPNIQVPPALIRAERWLLNQQMENGCFRNEGQVFHRELRGGLNEDGEIANVALTAYVITALIDSTTYLPYYVLRNTLTCLRAIPPLNKSPTSTRVYAHALLAYAYMKIDKYESDLRKTNKLDMNLEQDEGVKQMLELLQVAKRSGGYVWWEANSLSTSIEATSYALLSLACSPPGVRARGASDAAAAGLWLAAHRGPTGGFVSTQDTLVALEALTAWSPTAVGTHLNVTAHSGALTQTLSLHARDRLPDVIKLAPAEHLTVTVEGTGCALVQATRSYSTVSPAPSQQDKLLSVQVAVHTDGPFDCEHNQTNCYCAAVIEACVVWSGQFPEMALLEVWLPGGYGADAQLLYRQLTEPYTLLRRIELSPTNSRATFYLGSSDGSSPLSSGGHQCYNIHAVGVSARTKPAYARVQDYYVPAHNDTQLFTIPEDCPPRISHDTPQYTSADNLYTKARSLDGDEILISHDFSFEDIPDGIPLEDPLYDNLTKKESTHSDEILEENIKTNSDDTITKISDNLNTESVKHNAYQPNSQRDNFNMFTLNNNENTQNNNHYNKNTQFNNENKVPQKQEIQLPTAVKPEKITLQPVNNPNLADFHVIDSEKDLDLPTGIEGPIPAVVLPPVNFVPPRSDMRQFKDIHSIQTRHGPYLYFNPTENVINRRYFVPRRDYYQGRVR